MFYLPSLAQKLLSSMFNALKGAQVHVDQVNLPVFGLSVDLVSDLFSLKNRTVEEDKMGSF